MQTAGTNRKLRTILSNMKDKTLIPNPHFQRRLVWSNDHKVAFIATVLEGLPFPEIFIASGDSDLDTGEGQELIVDGQQRISTLYQYFTGYAELDLRQSGISAYTDLQQQHKRDFLNYDVVIRDLGQLSEQETLTVFQRINSTSYSLNAMEVNNSRFDGVLKKFAEEMAQEDFFESRRVFSSRDVKRMNDVRFLLTVIISVMNGYFNRDVEHEAYLERYNDAFEQGEEVRARLEAVMQFLDRCNLDVKSRAWNKMELLNLFVELDAAFVADTKVSEATFSRNLEQFFSAVRSPMQVGEDPMVSDYRRRAGSGSNDRSTRIFRAEAIRWIISESTAAQ